MTEPTAAAEAACRRLVIEFAHHLDHRRFKETAGLFADDGVWSRHGEELVGPDAVLSVISQRPDTQVERHVMTTILVDQISETECTAVSYALIFRHGDATSAPQPVVGEFHDSFRLTDAGWRFSHRTSVPAFPAKGVVQ